MRSSVVVHLGGFVGVDDVEVWLDSGIRTGQDLFKAIALGARATMAGRAYIYGLGAMGEAGVTKVIDMLKAELDITMAFCGLTDINDVTLDVIWDD